jgi:hypothetical protein
MAGSHGDGHSQGRSKGIRVEVGLAREVVDYTGWPLRDRLELLAFDARLAWVPPALLEALWEAIDGLGVCGLYHPKCR